MLVYIPV